MSTAFNSRTVIRKVFLVLNRPIELVVVYEYSWHTMETEVSAVLYWNVICPPPLKKKNARPDNITILQSWYFLLEMKQKVRITFLMAPPLVHSFLQKGYLIEVNDIFVYIEWKSGGAIRKLFQRGIKLTQYCLLIWRKGCIWIDKSGFLRLSALSSPITYKNDFKSTLF